MTTSTVGDRDSGHMLSQAARIAAASAALGPNASAGPPRPAALPSWFDSGDENGGEGVSNRRLAPPAWAQETACGCAACSSDKVVRTSMPALRCAAKKRRVVTRELRRGSRMAGAHRTLIAMDEFTDSTSWVSSFHSEHLGCIPSRPWPEGGGRNAGRSQRQTSRAESKSGERPTEETKGAKSAQSTRVAGETQFCKAQAAQDSSPRPEHSARQIDRTEACLVCLQATAKHHTRAA